MDGLRVISMFWVILGHTYAFMVSISDNVFGVYPVFSAWQFQAIRQATVSVDTFFVLSGTLVSYLLLGQLKKMGSKADGKFFIMIYVHRYLRLTLVYGFVILLYIGLADYISASPNQSRNTFNIDFCRKNWWTNLLYVNNFVGADKMCLGVTWYLANDMQFFLFAPPIIYLLYRFGVAGVGLLLAIIGVSMGLTANKFIQHNFSLGFIDSSTISPNYFYDYYIVPWTRMGAYAVGMLLGYILYRTKRKVSMHWAVALLCWIAAVLTGLAYVYGLTESYANERPLSYNEYMAYAVTLRVGWSIAVAWVIFACDTGFGGFVNSILSWSAWVPLSKLTYGAFLLHPILISGYIYAVVEAPIHFQHSTIVLMFGGFIMMSYGCAVVLYTFVEAPLSNLEKLLLSTKKK